MSVRAAALEVAGPFPVIRGAVLPMALQADESGSSDVVVTVEIPPHTVAPSLPGPVDCATGCGPAIADGLAATGGDVATLLVWIAIGLIVAGLLLAVWRVDRAALSRAMIQGNEA